jgi:hypothetical protein
MAKRGRPTDEPPKKKAIGETIGSVTGILVAVTAFLTAADALANKTQAVSCKFWAQFPWCDERKPDWRTSSQPLDDLAKVLRRNSP